MFPSPFNYLTLSMCEKESNNIWLLNIAFFMVDIIPKLLPSKYQAVPLSVVL